MAISKTVKEAWLVNDKVNKVLLRHLTTDRVETKEV